MAELSKEEIGAAIASAGEQDLTLLVKNIPLTLPRYAVEKLLVHYGATSVKLMGASTNMRGNAFASFATSKKLERAASKLNGMLLGDQRLVCVSSKRNREMEAKFSGSVEGKEISPISYVPTQHSKNFSHKPGGTVLVPDAQSTMHYTEDVNQTSMNRQPAMISSSQKAFTALAPEIGLNYSPSPLLEYNYPPPTQEVLANIARALAANRRFYDQTLHLMNKMNFPPPFEQRFPLVGLSTNIIPQQGSGDHGVESDERKRNLRAASASTQCERTALRVGQLTFDKAKKRKINHASINSSNALLAKSTTYHRPGVVSRLELEGGRVSEEEKRSQYSKLFSNYDVGEPSSTIYVKNVAKSVDESDLRFLFGCAVPSQEDMDKIKIKYFKDGRMKGQAFVSFGSIAYAQAAVTEINGYRLDGKPLIVVYKNEQ